MLGFLVPPNYKRLAKGSNSESEGDSNHSANATLRSYGSSRLEDITGHMTGNSNEVN